MSHIENGTIHGNNGNEAQKEEDSLESIDEIHNVFVGVLNVLRQERGGDDSLNEDQGSDDEVQHEEEQHEEDSQAPSSSEYPDNKRKKEREKFDSGLGDEIIENHSDSSDDDNGMKLDVISSSDTDEKQKEKRNKRSQRAKNGTCALKWRRIDANSHRYIAESSSENEADEDIKTDNEMRMYESPYTEYTKAKIQELPLPPILKRYLNFYREF